MNTKIPDMIPKIAMALVCVLLLSTCIREDWSTCPDDIRVYFDISPLAGGDLINPDDIDRMRLFVFSQEGIYLSEYRDDNIDEFNANYYISCNDLLPGDYRFIAWGGVDEDFYSVYAEPIDFVEGVTTFNQAFTQLLMPPNPDNIFTETVPHIFHGELAVKVLKERSQRFVMPLRQFSNTVIMYARFDNDISENHIFEFSITDNNSTFGFDRSFASDPDDDDFTFRTRHTTLSKINELNYFETSLNVMRLSPVRPSHRLRIYSVTLGREVFPIGTESDDLIELIRYSNIENYPVYDFEAKHNHEIIFEFHGGPTEVSVTVTILPWRVRPPDDEPLN